ncbi:MAG: major facilitator superfamily 1 [Firmicutes bacterium]|nr:major facilitator superfamily 1 [Bacillota bacterium]
MSQARLVFLAVLTTSFIGPFMGSAINLAIPAMGETFGANANVLSWVVTAYLLGSVMMMLPIGRLADIIGRKKVYTIGVILLIVFTLCAGFSESVEQLILFRLIQGMATAMIFSTGMAMIISVHKSSERGSVIGYSAAATYIGLSLGPMLGGMMTYYIGWRSIFFITATVLAGSLLAILKVTEEWYGAQGEAFDLRGGICYMIASPAILYGCSTIVTVDYARYLFVGGLLLLAVFVKRQLNCPSPIFDIKLFHGNTVFAMSNIAAMINYSATFAIGFILSLYLQLIRGLDAPIAGVILLIQPIIMALFSPKAGALSDKIEPRIVASIGMGLTTAGLIFFAFLKKDTPIELIAINFILIGLGFALFSSPNNNAIMGAVTPKYYGVAASALSVMRLVGQAISMAIVTFILSVYAIDTMSPEYLTNLLYGFNRIFLIFALLCAIGTMASLARGERKT